MSNNLNKYYKNGSSYEPRMQAVEQQVSQFIAGEVGKTVYFPTWYTPPHLLYIKPNGGLYSKTTYAALWAAFSGSAITSTEYDATVASSPVGACSRYADIDADTFRVPTVGTGGFMRSVGANGEMPIGSEDGGFSSQVEEHKHLTKLGYNHTSLGTYIGVTTPDNSDGYDWGGVDGVTAMKFVAGASGASGGEFNQLAFTSPETYDNTGETSPQGTYAQPYIFTGIVVSNLPEPTSADLAQIQANTDAITAIQQNLGMEVTSSSGTSGICSATTITINLREGADFAVSERVELDIATELGADWVGHELEIVPKVFNNTGVGLAKWADPYFVWNTGAGVNGGFGVLAHQAEDTIVVVTGNLSLAPYWVGCPNVFGINVALLNSPIKLVVTKKS